MGWLRATIRSAAATVLVGLLVIALVALAWRPLTISPTEEDLK